MFKKTRLQLTWVNAISYFFFLVIFLVIFYIIFSQNLNRIQEELVESYAANNKDRFFNIYNGPPKPPNRFELEVDQVSFFYVVSKEMEILYGEELHEGFNQVLENELKETESKYFQRFDYEGEHLLVLVQAVKNKNEILGYIAVGQDVTSYERLMNTVILILIFLLFISSIFIAWLSYVLAGKSIKPIEVAYENEKQFVANASHELRTPLTIISSSLDLFEMDLKTKESNYSVEEYTDIKNEVHYMNDMLNSLLYLTRADQNQIVLNNSEVDLTQVITQKTRKIARTAPTLQFELNLDESITLIGDKILIEELIYILLKNAVSYTPAGKVCLTTMKDAATIKILIQDTGIGMEENQLLYIFNRFYRIDESRHSSGTGLGLAIAKTIVELHKGRISVTSKVDEGTTFIIELPFKETM